MAQLSIREFDAKKMLADFLSQNYSGILIQSEAQIYDFVKNADASKKYIIKPDQLFWKRGKYGLIGVNLSPEEIQKWWKQHFKNSVTIGKKTGILDTFLIEDFISHKKEYYTAIKTERDCDILYFSENGGIEIEENWESVKEIRIPLLNTKNIVKNEIQTITKEVVIQDFLYSVYEFFKTYGFAYLEINPFVFDNHNSIACLDMVARVDSTEGFLQKKHWWNLEFPHSFGDKKTESEEYIDTLDASTGASLKLRILNPNGKIWLLTSGGGASVIIADTIADMGYLQEIANYGECSWNPDRENTCAYTEEILKNMILNGKKWQFLIIAGAIANFTHIDKTFHGIIDALWKYQKELQALDIQILVRRGGINDQKWLQMIAHACQQMQIACKIADGDEYMTRILENIHF